MEVVVTTGAISRAKLQSNHHHQQTNTKFFLQVGCPFCRPTNNVKALKGIISHSMDLLTQSLPRVFQLCLWPLIAPGYLGEGCHASHQPSDASTLPPSYSTTLKTLSHWPARSHRACQLVLSWHQVIQLTVSFQPKQNLSELPARHAHSNTDSDKGCKACYFEDSKAMSMHNRHKCTVN